MVYSFVIRRFATGLRVAHTSFPPSPYFPSASARGGIAASPRWRRGRSRLCDERGGGRGAAGILAGAILLHFTACSPVHLVIMSIALCRSTPLSFRKGKAETSSDLRSRDRTARFGSHLTFSMKTSGPPSKLLGKILHDPGMSILAFLQHRLVVRYGSFGGRNASFLS